MGATQDVQRVAAGDVIAVGGRHVGGELRTGEILEVRGEPGDERYSVRWDDGHESIFHPVGGDATIHHYASHGASVELMRGLAEQGIGFELLRHPRTATARDEALALHVPAGEVAKTIVVHTPEGRLRVVIPASERLALNKLRKATGSVDARFATEEELAAAYPAFELGAVPPFGGPDGDCVVVDRRVAGLETVIVEAGAHSDSLRIAAADLVRITGADVADVVAD